VKMTGTYDTLGKYFADLEVDGFLGTDMILALASFGITVLAMFIHTKSVWLSFMGILQIMFSIPLAYFVYYFIAWFKYFPFLNFIGVFVVAALGADDVFVAVDKWKNARLVAPEATTEEIASVALPDAAGAMLLTTATTSVAFFATTICPVTPLMCFAVFCGLLIILDFVMNIALVFPALCLYDIWLKNGTTNCCVAICTRKVEDVNEDDINEKGFNDDDSDEHGETGSLIYRILSTYYKFFHKLRWLILVGSAAALAVCIYCASRIELPQTATVQLLPDSNEFFLHKQWYSQLLADRLDSGAGTRLNVMWGILPGDNGDRKSPYTLSSLMLDKAFDPSSTDSQMYLRDFCDKMFENDSILLPEDGYECPINRFDSWLQQQYLNPTSSEYVDSCNGADGLPMSPKSFDRCFIAWSQMEEEYDVLENNGKIQVLIVKVRSTAYWTDPFNVVKKEWEAFEDFFDSEREKAPDGVNKMFHGGAFAFWFYDTNRAMLQTAVGAAGIAIAFSTFTVFVSSRSVMLTLFSVIAILYVLAATIASLVSLGWTLGFLESICIAILIGISCDFVMHFSHAYSHITGSVPRTERSKFTVIHMGPSILAAGITTVAASLLMLLCKVTFFTKFATILLMSITHATIGAFFVFLVLADVAGPEDPQAFVKFVTSKLCSKK